MANLSTTQIKVTIPDQLYFYVKSKADKFGLTASAYLKNLIIDDVKDIDTPTFRMSEEMEKKGIQALKEYETGKTIEITDIGEYFNNL